MKLIKNFPFVRQNTDWTCGPVAVKSVLKYFGINKSEIRLVDELGCTTEHGTDFDKVIDFFKRNNFKVTAKRTTLKTVKSFVRRNIPCLVCIQAWSDNPNIDYATDWDDGHFIIIIGYDNNNIIYEDPSIHQKNKRGRLSNKEFMKRWHDVDSKKRRFINYVIAVEETDITKNNRKKKKRAKLQRNYSRQRVTSKTS